MGSVFHFKGITGVSLLLLSTSLSIRVTICSDLHAMSCKIFPVQVTLYDRDVIVNCCYFIKFPISCLNFKVSH
jgi:hypothetical protein